MSGGGRWPPDSVDGQGLQGLTAHFFAMSYLVVVTGLSSAYCPQCLRQSPANELRCPGRSVASFGAELLKRRAGDETTRAERRFPSRQPELRDLVVVLHADIRRFHAFVAEEEKPETKDRKDRRHALKCIESSAVVRLRLIWSCSFFGQWLNATPGECSA